MSKRPQLTTKITLFAFTSEGFQVSHLVQHLDTVLTEPIMVVGFPWSPVGECCYVLIRP